MNKKIKVLRILAVVIIVSLLLVLLRTFRGLTVQELLSYSPESPFLAFLIIIGLYSLKSVTIFLPLIVLYIGAGILFTIPVAIAITYLGLTIELTIGYWIGWRFGSAGYDKIIQKNKTIQKWLKPSDKTFNTVCFILALLPGPLPLDITCMLLGATRISYIRFLLFSLLGLSPGMLAFVIAGDSIASPLSNEFLIPFSIALFITLITFVILQISLRKEDKQ